MFRARVAFLIGLFILLGTVGFEDLKAQGQKLFRRPEIINIENSQTIELLKGHPNLAVGGPVVGTAALVDGSALQAEATGGAEFSELGVSGHGQISTYIVRDGDTLSTIAEMFGVSVSTIQWANDLKGSRISPGQSLVILPISGVRHTVVKGDTLDSITKKYKANLEEVLAYNGLSASSTLSPGDIVIVPDGEIHSVVSSSVAYTPTNTVVPGYFTRPVVGGRKTQGVHGHNGIDIGGLPIGAPILAAAEGTVIIARTTGWNGGYGLYVVINHPNGTQTLYAHLSQVNVAPGESVTKGQVIGGMGNSGKVHGPTGIHLHFEVRGARNPF